METAAERLDRAFAGHAAEILADGGLGPTWRDALVAVPPEITDVDEPGTAILARLREFWSQQGDLRPAIAATRALLRWNAENRGADHPDTLVELSALGALALRAGRASEGGGLVERAWLALGTRVDDLRLAVVAGNVARWFADGGRLDEAEAALATAQRIRARLAPDTAGLVAAQRGEVLARLGRDSDAVPHLVAALAHYRRVFGEDHPATLARARALAGAYGRTGRPRDALPLWRLALDRLAESGDDEARATVACELGEALEALDERSEALRMLELAVRWTRAASRDGAPHPALPARVTTYANAELRRGRPAEAEGLLREAMDAERQLSGDASAAVAERYANLGALIARTGRVDEALGWLDTAASLLRTVAGDADNRTRRVVDTLVGLLLLRAEHALAARDRELAAVALARAWQVAAPVLGFVHEKTRKVRDLRDRHRLT